jgi:hypothetical protein
MPPKTGVKSTSVTFSCAMPVDTYRAPPTIGNVAKAVGVANVMSMGLVTPAAKLGFTGMAHGGTTATTGQYKGLVEIANKDDNSIPGAEKKMDDFNFASRTDYGTPVASSPSYCVWLFTDRHLRNHVGVSVVLPTSVGLSSKQLKNTVSDDGKSLRVNVTHQQCWSKTTFHKKACAEEGLSQAFTNYLVNAERAELEELAKLSGSDSREKIGTFVDIALPTVCELEIRYTIPIHHQNTSHVPICYTKCPFVGRLHK